MSWSFPDFSSWSPFGMRQGNASPINSQDYSYITPEDLEDDSQDRRHYSSSRSRDGLHPDDGQPQTQRRRPRRSHTNDIVILSYKRTQYPVHFPPWSIDDGEMTVGDLRDAAAQTLGVQDARRVRLFLQGKNLKDDGASLREENFHSQEQPTILVIVGEPLKNPHSAPQPTSTSTAPAPQPTSRPTAAANLEPRDDDEGSETDDNSLEPSSTASSNSSPRKKKKRKGHRGSKRKPASETPTSETSRSTSYTAGQGPQAEFLPGANLMPPVAQSASTSRQPSPHPKSPTEKLEQLASHFHDSLLPLCKEFTMHPPQDKAKRDFEYKKLSETVLQQVLLKADAIEVEGDSDLRLRRKDLVREVQGWLTALDEVVK